MVKGKNNIDNVSVISYGKIVIKAYKTEKGTIPYRKWIMSLKDEIIRARILQRLDRIEYGYRGSFKALTKDIHELKLNFGPGYRIYYGMEGKVMIVLLCAGDKSTQKKDIMKAKEYWQDYKEYKNERISDL